MQVAEADSRILQAVLRKDLLSFTAKAFEAYEGRPLQENWHLEAICYQLMRCVSGEIRRLIITLPPRSLKSFLVSTAFPAWLMGHNPRERIIAVSYAQDLSNKFARDQRSIMQQAWYQNTFSTQINPRKSAETEFETVAGGFRMATSVGGVLTGRGANYIILDDPIKPQDALSEAKRQSSHEWIDTTLFSRLDNKRTGVIILVMQRVHLDDTAAYLMNKGGWEILNLPAIAPSNMVFKLGNNRSYNYLENDVLHKAREPIEVLQQLKSDMGTFSFSAQYLQQPIPLEGNYLKREWFQHYESLPSQAEIVQSWDTAMTCEDRSDWSVCTTWAIENKAYYLVDVYRERLNFPSLKRKVMELKNRFNSRMVLIEEAVAGIALIQQLRDERIPVNGIRPEGTKAERMMGASLLIEQGAVLLPRKAVWLEELMQEMLSFPAGRHDDQVDSISQFLNWIQNRVICEPRIRFLG